MPDATLQPNVLAAKVSLAKNRLQTPEQYLEAASDDWEELIGRAWIRYAEHLARQRARHGQPRDAAARDGGLNGVRLARRGGARAVEVAGVVKADAYGLGAAAEFLVARLRPEVGATV